jgi:nucleoside-diphosphate-sugar epimerase
LEAESIVLDARCEDGQFLGTVLRLGAVYGTRMKGNYQRLLTALARGGLIPLRGGGNRRTLIYDKDVARAILLAVRHPLAAGRVYNVTDGSFYTVSEIIEAICQALGRQPPRFFLPASLVRFGVGIVEDIAGKGGWRLPLGRASIDTYMQDIAVQGNRIREELDFRPQYDLAAGWQDAVAEMRDRGDL